MTVSQESKPTIEVTRPDWLTDKLISKHIKHLEDMTCRSGYEDARLAMLRELQQHRASLLQAQAGTRAEVIEECAKVADVMADAWKKMAGNGATPIRMRSGSAACRDVAERIRSLSPVGSLSSTDK